MEVVAPSWWEKDSRLGKVGEGWNGEMCFVCFPALKAIQRFVPCLHTWCTVDKFIVGTAEVAISI